jgi:transketolase
MASLKAPRDVFGEVLAILGEDNEKIFVLDGDLAGGTKTSCFAEKFPHRYLNVGIAEQNMVGVGAGLARAGFIPIVSTFACFAPGRVYDQVRQSVAYSNLNVKIMSTHPGLAVGLDGAIHQSLDDISLMRELPNMVVLAPSDEISTKKAVERAISYEGPVYVRIGRKECPVHFDENVEFEIGKGYTLRDGKDIAIISHGSMVDISYRAAEKLEAKGISVRVIEMPTIKPLDEEIVLRAAKETKGIVVAEDHFKYGGLYSAVSEVVVDKYPCKVKCVAVEDTFGESGTPEELYKKYGLTEENIISKALNILEV